MGSRITIRDVARAAGVSPQTVSRAINDKDEIRPETRARILRIVEELGYRPNHIARSLTTHRTATLGLVVPDIVNPFFAEVARGVEDLACVSGYQVFLCNTDENPVRERMVLNSLAAKQVDGIILCSSRLGDEELRSVVAEMPSMVLVNRTLPGGEACAVVIEDFQGAQQAMAHLLGAGHRFIALLRGPTSSYSGRERLRGYREALAGAGLPWDEGLVMAALPRVEGGYQATMQLLARRPEVTAIFAYNDLVAVGALQACAAIGRRVPEEVAIVGFDDIPLASLVVPALTTVRVPRYRLGQLALEKLLLRLAGDAEPQVSAVECELVVRASAP